MLERAEARSDNIAQARSLVAQEPRVTLDDIVLHAGVGLEVARGRFALVGTWDAVLSALTAVRHFVVDASRNGIASNQGATSTQYLASGVDRLVRASGFFISVGWVAEVNRALDTVIATFVEQLKVAGLVGTVASRFRASGSLGARRDAGYTHVVFLALQAFAWIAERRLTAVAAWVLAAILDWSSEALAFGAAAPVLRARRHTVTRFIFPNVVHTSGRGIARIRSALVSIVAVDLVAR
jgi:hypothetical protein